MSQTSKVLQFEPFSSCVEPSFWQLLSKKKLDEYQLSHDIVPIRGYYTSGRHLRVPVDGNDEEKKTMPLPARLTLNEESFHVQLAANHDDPERSWISGQLVVTNTLEDFKSIDRQFLLNALSAEIWSMITDADTVIRSLGSRDIEKIATDDAASNPIPKQSTTARCMDPSALSKFLLIVYPDIKRYRYYYMFAFPALFFQDSFVTFSRVRFASKVFMQNDGLVGKKALIKDLLDPASLPMYFVLIVEKSANQEYKVLTLEEYDELQSRQSLPDNSKSPTFHGLYFGFKDPSAMENNPGWPLRNFLLLLRLRWSIKHAEIICIRSDDCSVVISIDISSFSPSTTDLGKFPSYQTCGWERNAQGKLAPRMLDLAPLMDPLKLFRDAVDLNLKLIRWRMLPSLNLSVFSNCRVLLFGAGTLGCNVARVCMGWGIDKITFVDSGKVSFSNPIRQSLFTYEDVLEGGKIKAKAAASRLREINPNVNVKGIELAVPMPGHLITDGNEWEERLALTWDLVKEHDVLFLLTDSRESRWLPTILGAVEEKIVITAALGFDSYVVMRHGMRSPEFATKTDQKPLGCYFCHDIVGPMDTLSNRTLDQQCTVTRPGLAYMASSLAVELLASILQHSLGPNAPASTTDSVLGAVPHQLRGFLTSFEHVKMIGHAFENCTACSKLVLDKVRGSGGKEFLKQAMETPEIIEEVSGLGELKKQAEKAVLAMETGIDPEIDDF